MDLETKTTSDIVSDCKYNVVFCTKYKRKVLIAEVKERLNYLLKNKISELYSEIIDCNIMQEHVRLLIKCDPQYGIHKVVKNLKGNTSTILREEFGHLRSTMPSLWTNSYFVSTVGEVSEDDVRKYIGDQKERTK